MRLPAALVPLRNPTFRTLWLANVVAWLVNVAVTERACVIETVQVEAPVHAPLQPVNVESVSASAVSVTVECAENDAVQVSPHVMPAGADETFPWPVPP